MGATVDGFIEQDARGVISGWSAESEQLFGWSRAEAIGMQSHRLIPERNRATHDHALADFAAPPDRPVRRQEITALHRDGREFRAEFAISLEGSGETLRVIAVVRAMAAGRAEAEAAFRQSERFRSILDQVEDGCCVVDPSWQLPVRQRRLLPLVMPGMDGYLSKPIDQRSLYTAVEA